MTPTRILALDIGFKRTGVAISDENRTIGFPLEVIPTQNRQAWLRRIIELTNRNEVSSIVVGLPLNQFGEEGDDAKKIREFIAALRESTNLPVIEWDERFTTVQAERVLLAGDVSRGKRKQVIDKMAASILLQAYLDSLTFDRS